MSSMPIFGYNLISKAVLLITYYELNERETLGSFTVSFRTFLNRQKDVPAQRREGYLNLEDSPENC
jgi:hypothetical protein